MGLKVIVLVGKQPFWLYSVIQRILDPIVLVVVEAVDHRSSEGLQVQEDFWGGACRS